MQMHKKNLRRIMNPQKYPLIKQEYEQISYLTSDIFDLMFCFIEIHIVPILTIVYNISPVTSISGQFKPNLYFTKVLAYF